MQSNRLTLIEMKSSVTAILSSLHELDANPLIGGFESKLATKLTIESDGKIFFKSIEMQPEGVSRTRQAQKNFADVRKSVLMALQTFLTERFQIDEELFDKIEPFIRFEKATNADTQYDKRKYGNSVGIGRKLNEYPLKTNSKYCRIFSFTKNGDRSPYGNYFG